MHIYTALFLFTSPKFPETANRSGHFSDLIYKTPKGRDRNAVPIDVLIKWIFAQYRDHLTEKQKAEILQRIRETERGGQNE